MMYSFIAYYTDNPQKTIYGSGTGDTYNLCLADFIKNHLLEHKKTFTINCVQRITYTYAEQLLMSKMVESQEYE